MVDSPLTEAGPVPGEKGADAVFLRRGVESQLAYATALIAGASYLLYQLLDYSRTPGWRSDAYLFIALWGMSGLETVILLLSIHIYLRGHWMARRMVRDLKIVSAERARLVGTGEDGHLAARREHSVDSSGEPGGRGSPNRREALAPGNEAQAVDCVAPADDRTFPSAEDAVHAQPGKATGDERLNEVKGLADDGETGGSGRSFVVRRLFSWGLSMVKRATSVACRLFSYTEAAGQDRRSGDDIDLLEAACAGTFYMTFYCIHVFVVSALLFLALFLFFSDDGVMKILAAAFILLVFSVRLLGAVSRLFAFLPFVAEPARACQAGILALMRRFGIWSPSTSFGRRRWDRGYRAMLLAAVPMLLVGNLFWVFSPASTNLSSDKDLYFIGLDERVVLRFRHGGFRSSAHPYHVFHLEIDGRSDDFLDALPWLSVDDNAYVCVVPISYFGPGEHVVRIHFESRSRIPGTGSCPVPSSGSKEAGRSMPTTACRRPGGARFQGLRGATMYAKAVCRLAVAGELPVTPQVGSREKRREGLRTTRR